MKKNNVDKKGIFEHSKYLFLFTHPDEETYTSALIGGLIKKGKQICIIYATSGDYYGLGDIREGELTKSLELIGVPLENVHLLSIPEKELLDSIYAVVSRSIEIAKEFQPDCVIGQDYEGGHNGHDAVSFCAQEVARKLEIKNNFVFPVYHGIPANRKGARFKPGRKNIITIPLIIKESDLKRQIVEIHASQADYFNGLQKASPDYFELLFSREVYFKVEEPIDFTKRPMEEIGYEFSGKFTFGDFRESIEKYHKEQHGL